MTRDEFIKEIVDGMRSGDLQELLGEVRDRFMTFDDEAGHVIDELQHEDVEKFANMLADWVMGPR